jgi:hypothetical protein
MTVRLSRMGLFRLAIAALWFVIGLVLSDLVLRLVVMP